MAKKCSVCGHEADDLAALRRHHADAGHPKKERKAYTRGAKTPPPYLKR